jgi:hypothetical protein
MKYILSNNFTIEFFVENEKKAIGQVSLDNNINVDFGDNLPSFPAIISIENLKLSNPNFYNEMEINTLWCKLEFLILRKILDPELIPEEHKQAPSINKFWKLVKEDNYGNKYKLFTDDCEPDYDSAAYITTNILCMNDDNIIENQIGTIIIKLPNVTFYHEPINIQE